MASLTAVAPAVRARSRLAAHAGTLTAVGVSLAFSCVFVARTTFTVGRTTYFSLFDDAMVSMQYARNLAHGDGLVWNAHQPAVEGYTNFLWTIWMAALHLVGLPEPKISLAVMVSGALLLVANVLVVGSLTRLLGGDDLTRAIAMVATALYYPLVYWTLRGMEVGLLAFVISSATFLSLRLVREGRRRDLVCLCVLLAAGALTRPDAALLMLCFGAYVTCFSPRADRLRLGLPLLAAALVPAAALTLFRELYYHALLPNTYYLKVASVPLDLRLHRGAAAFLDLELNHLWAPTVATLALFVCRRRIGRELGLLVVVIASACLYSVYVGGDAWEWMGYSNRYIAPVVPLLLVLASLGVREVVAKRARRRAGLLCLGLGAAAAFGLSALPVDLTEGVSGLGQVELPAFALLTVSFVLATAIALRRGGERAVRIATWALAASLLVLALNADPLRSWIAYNGYHVADDAMATRRGLELRAETTPSTTIAVISAGAIPYFAHRPAIDLLGKSDPVIARRPIRMPYNPGHSKWDYAYSIGTLRPDVIAQGLWFPTQAEMGMLASWGYREVTPKTGTWPLYVRRAADFSK